MIRPLTEKERAALAMHELMKREQEVYRQRIEEQRKMSTMSDADLKKLVAAPSDLGRPKGESDE